MVRIINIDTKARTIRVSNEDKDIDWITVKGTHVPIKKGESKGEAVEKFFEDKGRKFYRGSVVHKDTIDGLKKAKDKHGETMKYWESEGKKNHKEKGYADFVKKEIEAQKQYAKRLDESIADISRDFEIDPEDVGMNKEFDDWKKSKQPAKKNFADTSEIEEADFKAWKRKDRIIKAFKSGKISKDQLEDALDIAAARENPNDTVLAERAKQAKQPAEPKTGGQITQQIRKLEKAGITPQEIIQRILKYVEE